MAMRSSWLRREGGTDDDIVVLELVGGIGVAVGGIGRAGFIAMVHHAAMLMLVFGVGVGNV